MTRAKAKQLRQLIEQLAVTLDDETALTGVELFPHMGSRQSICCRRQSAVQRHAVQMHTGAHIADGLDAECYTCVVENSQP